MIPFFVGMVSCLGVFFRSRYNLGLEILALRQQLAVLKLKNPRPRLSVQDRIFWVLLRRLWPSWSSALVIVKPETIVAWHRAGFRLFWRLRSRPKCLGRPQIDVEVRALIRRMVSENPSWDLTRRLRQHLAFLREDALSRGDNNPRWLFCNSEGHPLDPAKIATAMQRFLKRAKLPHFTQYDMRHTYASLLLAKSAPITYVSHQMGHNNPTTTLKYYAHWIPDSAKRYCELLDRADAVQPEAVAAEAGKSWHQKLAPNGVFVDATPQVVDLSGAPGTTRTCDLLIRRESRSFGVIPQ